MCLHKSGIFCSKTQQLFLKAQTVGSGNTREMDCVLRAHLRAMASRGFHGPAGRTRSATREEVWLPKEAILAALPPPLMRSSHRQHGQRTMGKPKSRLALRTVFTTSLLQSLMSVHKTCNASSNFPKYFQAIQRPILRRL